MFQIDEKVIKDSRTLITIQGKKHEIDHLTKNGTINYTMNDDNLWLTTPKVRRAYINRSGIEDSYDKIVLARNGTDIDGNYVFTDQTVFNDNVELKKDLVVRGNLTVEGKSTIIDTPSLSIEDNIIELNKNEIGEGISLKKSGMAINRGTKDFARVLFSDNDKAFVLDTNENIDGDITTSDWIVKGYAERNGEYEPGEFRARHRLTAPFGKFTDSISVANQTTLNHLTTNGNVNLRGNTTASDLTVNGNFTANNSSEFNGLLTANRVSTFNDNLITNSALMAKGVSSFDELATFNKGIKITSNGANITGPVTINGALSATENVNFHKDLSVVSNISSKSLQASETVTTKDLRVNRDATITRDVTVDGSLEVNTYSMINGGVEIHNDLAVSCESNFNNNVNVRDNLNVRGQLNIKDNAVLEKNLTVNGDVTIEGSTSMNGPVEIAGADLTVENVIVNNDIKFQQGNGKGVTFWNSENYKIYMASATDGNYGGRLDTTSDYNMYFKMSSGTNRGFVFKNGSTPVFQIESTGQVRVKDKIISKGYDVLTRANEGHKSDTTGINADKLDDLHATDFLRRNTDTDTTGSITFNSNGKAIKFNGGASIYSDNGIVIKTDNAVNNGIKVQSESGASLFTIKDSGLTFKSNTVWHKGNQGHGSTLDADTLDGIQASGFSLVDHLHDDRYIRNNEVDLKGKYRIQYDEEFDCLDFMYIGDTL